MILVGVVRSAHAQVAITTIVVDTTADAVAADGHCSLREAIMAANQNFTVVDTCAMDFGEDTRIVFQLGSGNPQIDITSTLPFITDKVTINGATGGATRVVLHGASVTASEGLFIAGSGGIISGGSGTVIRNLVLNSFSNAGIYISGAVNVTVAGNYIGTDATGTLALPNGGIGVYSQGAGAIIGGPTGATPGGACTGDCNVIAFNSNAGVYINLSNGAINNIIRANSIHDNVGAGIAYGVVSGAPPPVVLTANTAISGTACNNCIVDVFADDADEGKTWLGSAIANGSGAWALGVPAIGPHITATSTSNATSVFSAPFTCADADGDGICNTNDNCTLVANPNQRDSDGDGFGNLCDGDFDGNNAVSFPDLAIFRSRFGTTNADADLDGNGQVSFPDLAIFRSLFGKPPGPSAFHP
jgi:CSLREA domain-containing protein